MPTVLLTVAGMDRPGLTASLLSAVTSPTSEVLDAEQIVIRNHLTLGLLLSVDDLREVEPVVAVATDLGLSVSLDEDADVADPRRRGRVVVTVMGEPLRPTHVAEVAAGIARCGGNIDRIERVAGYPLVVLRMTVSGAAETELREALATASAATGLDVAVQRMALTRRGTHLVVMDVDSTLIRDEVIELIARHAGCEDEVRDITAAAMRGELDFTASLSRRVALFRGVPAERLEDVKNDVRLTPGARTLCRTLKRLGYRIAVVSGGFTQVVEPLAEQLGIDYVAANELEIADGVLTGRVVGPVIDRQAKADALQRFAEDSGIPVEQTVAIGDGANDIEMITLAGLGIAFNAKPALAAEADTTVRVPYLDAVLHVLGITREEIEEADRN